MSKNKDGCPSSESVHTDPIRLVSLRHARSGKAKVYKREYVDHYFDTLQALDNSAFAVAARLAARSEIVFGGELPKNAQNSMLVAAKAARMGNRPVACKHLDRARRRTLGFGTN